MRGKGSHVYKSLLLPSIYVGTAILLLMFWGMVGVVGHAIIGLLVGW